MQEREAEGERGIREGGREREGEGKKEGMEGREREREERERRLIEINHFFLKYLLAFKWLRPRGQDGKQNQEEIRSWEQSNKQPK